MARQTTPAHPADRQDSKRFRAAATYTIGQLKAGADAMFPETYWSRKPVDKGGRHFTSQGCRTPETYFRRNPDGLTTGETWYIYERLPDGSLTFFHSGSFDPPKAAPGLADGPEAKAFPSSFYPGSAGQAPGTPGNGVIREMLEAHERQIHEIMSRYEQMMGQVMSQNQQVIERYQQVNEAYTAARVSEAQAHARAEQTEKLIEHEKEIDAKWEKFLEEQAEAAPSGLSDPAFWTTALQALPMLVNMFRGDSPGGSRPPELSTPDGPGGLSGAPPIRGDMPPMIRNQTAPRRNEVTPNGAPANGVTASNAPANGSSNSPASGGLSYR